VDPAGILTVVGDAADPIRIDCLGAEVRINGEEPETGPAPAADVTGLVVDAGPGANVIDLRALTPDAFPSLRAAAIDGGGGTDRLLGPDVEALWTVTATDVGEFEATAPWSIGPIGFRSVENLAGGSLPDEFRFSDGARLTGGLDGGGGANRLDLGDLHDDLLVSLRSAGASGFSLDVPPIAGGVTNVADIVGGTGEDQLVGLDGAATWMLTNGASRVVLDGMSLGFSRFESVEGGPGPDRFDLVGDGLGNVSLRVDAGAGDDVFRVVGIAAIANGLEGGPGRDTLDFSRFDVAIAVTLTDASGEGYAGSEPSALGPEGFQGVDVLIGLASTPEMASLQGRDSPATWDLGPVSVYTDDAAIPLELAGFGVLQGGSGPDRFRLHAELSAALHGGPGDDQVWIAEGAAVDGSADGQDGRDRIDLSAWRSGVTVHLGERRASGLTGPLLRFEDATGGAGSDLLVGDGSDNELRGGPGDDVLVPIGGRDRLFGGVGADRYRLALDAGGTAVLVDGDGENALDLAGATRGVGLDLDAPGEQEVAPGSRLVLAGRFTTVMGSPEPDTIRVAVSAVARRLDGGPPSGYPGDALIVGARGVVVEEIPGALFPAGSAIIEHARFERLDIQGAAAIRRRETELVLAAGPLPQQVERGLPLVIPWTVSNRGPRAATGVALRVVMPEGTELISAASDQGTWSVTGSTVEFRLGTLAPGATVAASLRVRPLRLGDLRSSAIVTLREFGIYPERQVATGAAIVVPQGPPPRVAALTRAGVHRQPTVLSVAFDQGLDARTAEDLRNYRLVGPGRDGRFGTRDDGFIVLASASYDPASRRVTLVPARRLPLRAIHQLTLNGPGAPGVRGLDGRLLDGDRDGRPGGAAVVRFAAFRFRFLTPRR
jgi:Ca2+-binding RTX toxin-like protein